MELPLVMGFLDEDKIGTIQPHDDEIYLYHLQASLHRQSDLTFCDNNLPLKTH